MHKVYLDTNRAPKSAQGGRLFGVGLNQMSAKQETSVCVPSGSFCFILLFGEALKLGVIYHMIIVFIRIHSFTTFRRDVNQVYIRVEIQLVDRLPKNLDFGLKGFFGILMPLFSFKT